MIMQEMQDLMGFVVPGGNSLLENAKALGGLTGDKKIRAFD